jgi:hypothetical protein
MNFDISRLRRADRIVGVSAIALFIFMFFFKWYGVSSNVSSFAGINVNVSRTGWETFTVSRWIWLLTIVVALGAVAIAAGALKLELPVQRGVLVAGLGALSTLLILYRILHHPTANVSIANVHSSIGIKFGIWLGLIAAAGITYGGYLGMQAEGTSLADVRAQATDAMGNLSAAVGNSQPATEPTPMGVSSEPLAPPIPPPATAPGAEPGGQAPAEQ